MTKVKSSPAESKREKKAVTISLLSKQSQIKLLLTKIRIATITPLKCFQRFIHVILFNFCLSS